MIEVVNLLLEEKLTIQEGIKIVAPSQVKTMIAILNKIKLTDKTANQDKNLEGLNKNQLGQVNQIFPQRDPDIVRVITFIILFKYHILTLQF